MSTYMMMPKDYYRHLQSIRQENKANAFFNYCFNLDEKNNHSVRFYADKWNVSLGTAHAWLKDFIEEVHKHHDFWVLKNEENRPKMTERYPEQKLNAQLNAQSTITSGLQQPTLNAQLNKNRTETEQRINTINTKDIYKGKKQGFSVPTIEEIKEYIGRKELKVDAENFYYHYESNGWMVGKNKMKSWTAALNTWNRNRANFQPTKKQKGSELI